MKVLQEVDKEVILNPDDHYKNAVPVSKITTPAEFDIPIAVCSKVASSRQSINMDVKSITSVKKWTTLQVGSQIDFSAASKASSHALSMNSLKPVGEVPPAITGESKKT